MVRRIEDAIQEQLILWLKAEHPDVAVDFNKNEGKKTIATAMKDQRMGQRAGRPDLQLSKKVRSTKHYLQLEIKKLKGKLLPSQKEYHAEFVPAANDRLEVGYGFEQCKEIITNWLQSLR
jgi:hypothetical protein